jgi:hypothetical protein
MSASDSAMSAGLSDPSISNVLLVHARPRLDRREEAHLVESVVERCPSVGRDSSDLHLQGSDERERQVAVGDRGAIWALARCALDIDVNPLPVAAALGELVDARLIDRDPARDAEFLSDKSRKIRQSEFRHRRRPD